MNDFLVTTTGATVYEWCELVLLGLPCVAVAAFFFGGMIAAFWRDK